jgi:hypothetical protein
MNWKKFFPIILFLLVAVGIGFGLYWLFFRAPAAPPAPPEELVNVPITPLPIAEEGVPPTAVPEAPAELPEGVSAVAEGGVTVVTPVTDLPTTGASISSSGTLNWYNRTDNKFYRMNRDGSVTSLSGKEFFNVSDATFDQNGDKAIIEYPDGSNIVYDFTTGTQVTLPKHWEEFSWSPDSEQIVAKSIGLDTSNRYLVVSNPDGSGVRAVQELGNNADQVQVEWSPNNQMVATATTGDFLGGDSREVYLIGMNHENFRSLTVEGLNFQPKWSPGGGQLLYSTASYGTDYKPGLWIVDASGNDIGKNRRLLNVNTWADKCTFKGDSTLYCAVPDELPEGAGLQPAVADDTPDSLYRIDIDTGLMTKLAIPEGDHTIDRVMISPDESTLYFTDKYSGLLNKIMLK